jgi:hypothetical protein
LVAFRLQYRSDFAEEAAVVDILIRGVPNDLVAAIDAQARRVGVSRSEYLRRALSRERSDSETAVSIEDLVQAADRFADLNDVDVMRGAWT